MSLLNLEALRNTPVTQEPFQHFVVSDFVDPTLMDRVIADYPAIDKGGSFPQNSHPGGPTFESLCQELRGEPMRAAFADKFGMDLTDRPTTLTVRARCRLKDGKIHIDSKTKLITVLLYLNRDWDSPGGNLRLLRSPDDIEDAIEEVAPECGTLVAFRCRENA